ncbi:DUF2079 domain-containing protein [Lacunimicrobium album]
MTTNPPENRIPVGPTLALMIFFLLGVLMTQSWLDTEAIANQFLAPQSWLNLLQMMGTRVELVEQTPLPHTTFISAAIIYASCLLMTFLLALLVRLISTRSLSAFSPSTFPYRISSYALPLALPAAWSLLEILNAFLGSQLLTEFLIFIPPFIAALTFASLMTTLTTTANLQSPAVAPLSPKPQALSPFLSPLAPSAYRLAPYLLAFIALSTFMNFGLYFSLNTPHGDTAMYEEHLWNFLHGKGFRSYLDQGLFLGEHIQFIHLFLIPVYILYPSHLTMELCETIALASGAIPIYWMTRRNTDSHAAAMSLSICYLLYSPMHFLDIEIDLKSFRPEAFGIPLLLFTLDQYDRKRIKSFLALLAFTTITVKEDYAIIVSSLGVWMLMDVLVTRYLFRSGATAGSPSSADHTLLPSTSPSTSDTPSSQRLAPIAQRLLLPLSLIAAGAIYLKLALATIVWFRSGVEVHYAGYFTRFGKSTSDIIWTMLTNPLFVLNEFATWSTFLYAAMLLVPLAFLPLFTLRSIAALPIFILLCLNEVAHDPRHHFHAPIIPLLFWAAATAGLPNAAKLLGGLRAWGLGLSQNPNREGEAASEPLRSLQPRINSSTPTSPLPNYEFRIPNYAAPLLATFAAFSAWGCAFTLSISPLSLVFWDPYSNWNYNALYIPGERAKQFEKVLAQIPTDANVASTDYPHTRFTHFRRSYDYSNFKRKVAGNTTGVPDDTDYIVIDTRHPYSTIKTPSEVPQLRDHPDQWELLPDQTDGYFIVLKREQAEAVQSPLP